MNFSDFRVAESTTYYSRRFYTSYKSSLYTSKHNFSFLENIGLHVDWSIVVCQAQMVTPYIGQLIELCVPQQHAWHYFACTLPASCLHDQSRFQLAFVHLHFVLHWDIVHDAGSTFLGVKL
jgi:hypothetical protein